MKQQTFGEYLRKLRKEQTLPGRTFSVRGLAAKVQVASCYVSKVERGDVGPPSEATIKRLAEALGENPVRMLAKGGKIPTELKAIILKRPLLTAETLHRLDRLSDEEIRRMLAAYPGSAPGRDTGIPFEPDRKYCLVAEDRAGYEKKR